MVGGGSGGHVTPILAIIDALYAQDCSDDIEFWCDKKYYSSAKKLVAQTALPIRLRTIWSGKLRRYHNTSITKQLADVSTLFRNIVDSIYVGIGVMQTLIRFVRRRPDTLFLKGGFVCLPVGLAARILKIPYIIHDSDAHPGLTNRILATRATKILTGAPLEHYNYPPDKAIYVGIPVHEAFQPFTAAQKQHTKISLGVPEAQPLIVVTGGGLGASRINDSMVQVTKALLEKNISVIHLCGANDYKVLKQSMPTHKNYRLIAFVDNPSLMARLFGAADLVITRAGATTLAELAASAAPVLLLPNKQLTGGHQIKNAEVYMHAEAATMLDEMEVYKNPQQLYEAIMSTCQDEALRQKLSTHIQQFARYSAAADIAHTILQPRDTAKKG